MFGDEDEVINLQENGEKSNTRRAKTPGGCAIVKGC